jgi:hypothetical protein
MMPAWGDARDAQKKVVLDHVLAAGLGSQRRAWAASLRYQPELQGGPRAALVSGDLAPQNRQNQQNGPLCACGRIFELESAE